MTASYVLPIWELAEIVITRKGVLLMERELPLGAWWGPTNIEMDPQNDALVWRPPRKGQVVMSEPGVLREFIELAGANNEAILDYARRWGVLELCDHGWPRTHNPPAVNFGASRTLYSGRGGPCPLRPTEGGDRLSGPYFEPLARWRALAAQVRAVVNLAAEMRLGRRGNPAEWMIATNTIDAGFGPEFSVIGPDWTGDPWILSIVVQELLEIGNVRPLFHWKGEGGYGIEIGCAGHELFGSGLFGAIASNLAFMLARADGLAICSGCGNAFSLNDSRPRTGKNQYCKTCRAAGIDQRERQRQYRQRKKADAARR